MLKLCVQILSTLVVFYRLFLLVLANENNGTQSFIHLTRSVCWVRILQTEDIVLNKKEDLCFQGAYN